MQLGAIGFELRFVRHRADQRMMKYILGLAGEPHLIDKLAPDQIINGGFDPRGGQQVEAEPRRRLPPPRSMCAWPPDRGGRCARR